MERTRETSTPTIPNAAVKMRSKKLLANELKGLTHPGFCAAVRASAQTLSVTNGGEVLLK